LRAVGLPDLLAPYAVVFGGWEGFAPAQRPAASGETCFLPQIAVQPDKDGLALAVGYGLMRDGARVGGAGLRSLLTPTRLPAEATPAARAAMAQADLAQAMIPLAQQAAAQIRPAP
jgi:hypothetical protein